MSHELFVWAGDRRLGRIEHDARDDRWALVYDAQWLVSPEAYALAPALPLVPPPTGYASASIKRFIEHLLPEGRAFDVAVAYNGVAKTNVFGLIRALGSETAGALRFTAEAATSVDIQEPRSREVTRDELAQRIAERETVPLTVWDGRVRMSVAGLQDKLLVYLPGDPTPESQVYLVDGQRLASTHILKPDATNPRTPHLAINEHFCMSLARLMKLPVAEVWLWRMPTPVLVIRRFDRAIQNDQGLPRVQRHHIIDTCQALDLPVSFKYERNIGNGPEVRHIRDGVSFPGLFGCARQTLSPAATSMTMLRWALFQFLIGNSDAHGKNFSFFMRPGSLLEAAPWYDLVSVLQYEGFDTDMAMAFGDEFVHYEITPFALADFAVRCDIDRKLMRREGKRLCKLAAAAARQQAQSTNYQAHEQAFVGRMADFVEQQAERLAQLLDEAAKVKSDYL